MYDETLGVLIEYGTIENVNLYRGGWLPLIWDDGRQIGDTYGRGFDDRGDAVRVAQHLAEERAKKYAGDYRVTITERN